MDFAIIRKYASQPASEYPSKANIVPDFRALTNLIDRASQSHANQPASSQLASQPHWNLFAQHWPDTIHFQPGFQCPATCYSPFRYTAVRTSVKYLPSGTNLTRVSRVLKARPYLK